MQTCINHLIRNTFRLTSRRYSEEIERDIKPIYTAANAASARWAFDELAEKWGAALPGGDPPVGQRLNGGDVVRVGTCAGFGDRDDRCAVGYPRQPLPKSTQRPDGRDQSIERFDLRA